MSAKKWGVTFLSIAIIALCLFYLYRAGVFKADDTPEISYADDGLRVLNISALPLFREDDSLDKIVGVDKLATFETEGMVLFGRAIYI